MPNIKTTFYNDPPQRENFDYGFETVSCAICDSQEVINLPCLEAPKGGQAVICKVCGLVYLSPRPNADFYRRFYGEQYWQEARRAREDDLERKIKEEDADSPKRDAFVASLANWIKPGSKALEVGCGFATTLRRIRDKYHCEALGIEPHKSVADIGRKIFGVNIYNGGLDDFCSIGAHNGEFDFIILHHVFEHMLDPVAALGKLRKLLRPGGAVYIAVPDASLGHKHVSLRHVYAYSPWTMFLLLFKAGFKILDFTADSSLRGPLKRGINFVAAPANDHRPPMPFEFFLRGSDVLRLARKIKINEKARAIFVFLKRVFANRPFVLAMIKRFFKYIVFRLI
ncbi:class I SAM-dependent methyltransferase [Candidatus Uhrbacteria bacterium]|nr:class I SAM-dependent methyltransferase [Candidatus Uhrbacteria bacterium]